jgi:hypothetical protein
VIRGGVAVMGPVMGPMMEGERWASEEVGRADGVHALAAWRLLSLCLSSVRASTISPITYLPHCSERYAYRLTTRLNECQIAGRPLMCQGTLNGKPRRLTV